MSSVTNHNPAILFLDEPFIGQDKEGRDFIIRIILKGAKTGGASIVITHDPSFAFHYCTRIVFLDKGSIILDGPPSSVLNRLEKMGKDEYAPIEVSV